MLPKGFSEALDEDLPILFAKIGWTHFYNGTEPVFGGSSFVKAHPDDNGESSCFKRDNGSFCGFAGRGKNMPDRIHIVFLASEPISGIRKIIGLYAGAHLDESREWLV